ncbi:MAG: hypothetical protein EOP50_00875 [Sphingobacteriales bacterium]|nr:MAG: hypothetical protein EOP50_00875 [Sphingobacteriales bacterium]
MIEGKDNVLAWYRTNEMPYWVIFYKGKSETANPVFRSNQEDGASFSQAFDELTRCLTILNRGQYDLVAMQKPGMSKGTFRISFEIPIGAPGAIGAVAPAASGSGITKEEMLQALATEREKWEKDLELKNARAELARLQKENRELERENRAPMQQLIGAFAPLAPQIAGMLKGNMPAAAPIAGVPANQPLDINEEPEVTGGEETFQPTAEQLDRVGVALATIARHEGEEWVELLERIAAAVDKNPALLSQVKMFI